MVFAFSMGVTSPLIGRKEIISIVTIAFILGSIGGYFFIYPIYEESPYIIGTVQGLFSMEDEVINLNIPSTSNISDVTSKISNLEGVNSVSTNGFELKTGEISDTKRESIINYLSKDSDIESYDVESNYITVNLANDESSTSTLGSLVSWLSNEANIGSEFAFVHIQVKANANDVVEIKEYLKDNSYTILSVEGPVHNTISFFNGHMIPDYIVTIICGIIGVIVSIMGIYVDPLVKFFRKFRKSRSNRL